jgi:hypothetical protein
MTPSQIGERAEAAVVAALIQLGKVVYVPFGASGRCDLIFEDATGLARVQVKNAVCRGDIVFFRTASNTKNEPKDYRGQIDFFGVYCHDTASAYLVPVDAVPLRAGTLRLTPPANNQRKLIRWAQDYRLPWAPPQLVLEGFTIRPDTDDLVTHNNQTALDSDSGR